MQVVSPHLAIKVVQLRTGGSRDTGGVATVANAATLPVHGLGSPRKNGEEENERR